MTGVAIDIRYCRGCGQMENMRATFEAVTDRKVIEVWCPCGAEPPRVMTLDAHEDYYLRVETRTEEGEPDDDPDSGDVQAI